MKAFIFYWWLLNGTIVPTGEQHEGHKLYHVVVDNNTAIENAYKGEILNYIKTGTFVYNDFYEWEDEDQIIEETFYTKN
jgi:hypothetical protein